jgi:hypothetical protein
MKQGGKMKYHSRFFRLENLVDKQECIPAVALQFLNGTVHWAGRIFPNEADFHKAVESTFRNEPSKPGPQVIVVTFWRDMQDYNLDILKGKHLSG